MLLTFGYNYYQRITPATGAMHQYITVIGNRSFSKVTEMKNGMLEMNLIKKDENNIKYDFLFPVKILR